MSKNSFARGYPTSCGQRDVPGSGDIQVGVHVLEGSHIAAHHDQMQVLVVASVSQPE